MAKDKEATQEEPVKESNNATLAKALIKELNKGDSKIAWNLATDLDNPTDVKEFISTGSTLLDYIIANKKDGGIPVGKISEISGEEASGKSLVCAHLIANVQKKDGLAIYIDTENAANPEFMRRLGVDISKMVYLQPQTVEEVGEVIEKIIINIRSKAPNRLVLIVWDSVAGTPCQAEIEGDYDPNSRMGVTAKALAKMMRKLTQVWGKERICMLCTNQLKVKLGVMYGDPMQTPGGKAIPYAASVRVRLTRSAEIKEKGKGDEDDKPKGQTYGIKTYAKVVKDRLGPPLRKCEFEIHFADGIDDVGSWFGYLHEAGEIEKAGGWCTSKRLMGDERFREADWKQLMEQPTVRQKALDLIGERLVITYKPGEPIPGQEHDPESLMEAQEAGEVVT